VKRWWGDFPFWCAWKAQLIAESNLRADAVSPVGAMGIAQIMPGTWADLQRQMGLPLGSTPFQAEVAIEAGAFYMAKRRADWRAPRPLLDRQQLAQASYNAGHGNLLAAQRACGGRPLYREIIVCLPQVTGAHSRETIQYVDRIQATWTRLEATWAGC
jgi:membrane-bound lytic murein transglycosylase F